MEKIAIIVEENLNSVVGKISFHLHVQVFLQLLLLVKVCLFPCAALSNVHMLHVNI